MLHMPMQRLHDKEKFTNFNGVVTPHAQSVKDAQARVAVDTPPRIAEMLRVSPGHDPVLLSSIAGPKSNKPHHCSSRLPSLPMSWRSSLVADSALYCELFLPLHEISSTDKSEWLHLLRIVA